MQIFDLNHDFSHLKPFILYILKNLQGLDNFFHEEDFYTENSIAISKYFDSYVWINRQPINDNFTYNLIII